MNEGTIRNTQFSSVAQLCPTLCNLCTVEHQASLSITNFCSLLKSCPSSWWCHLIISSSVAPFSSCLQCFPASGSFPMSWLFPSGGQSIGVSASALVPPINIQGWFPLGWIGWISLQSKGLSTQESSPAPQFKTINSSVLSFLCSPTLTSIHDYWENHSFD